MSSFLKNFKAALQYANYDFYKLKNEIVALIMRGREQGLDNPDYCKLTVKNSSLGRDYPVFIDLYYKVNNDEAIHLPQELLIGTFSTMPSSIRQIMVVNGFVEIIVNNIAELSLSANEAVSQPIKFESILNFSSSHESLTSRQVTIKDEIFAYRVIYKYDTTTNREQSKVVTYADIIDCPSDIALKLKTDGTCILKLD